MSVSKIELIQCHLIRIQPCLNLNWEEENNLLVNKLENLTLDKRIKYNNLIYYFFYFIVFCSVKFITFNERLN